MFAKLTKSSDQAVPFGSLPSAHFGSIFTSVQPCYTHDQPSSCLLATRERQLFGDDQRLLLLLRYQTTHERTVLNLSSNLPASANPKWSRPLLHSN